MNDTHVIGQSKAIRSVLSKADEFAKSEWPILIMGETGVGKELIARRIHEQSRDRAAPFVPLNCSAIPNGLFESELFGHERGAFSGAFQSGKGLVRQARGGTLFLDEVGELEPAGQTKLLRFLDSGEIRSVGSLRTEIVSARVVAATNVNLHQAVYEGTFRLDLLERLSVLRIMVPPLRERTEDIEPIARYCLDSHQAVHSDDFFDVLTQYDWPGNVRQLRNVLARAAALSSSRVTPALVKEILEEERGLSRWLVEEVGCDGMHSTLAEIEKQVILTRIRQCGGNRKRAAKELGIAKSTLHEKLRRWRAELGEKNNGWITERMALQF